MKFSRILVLCLSAVALPYALALPLRHVDHCSLDSTDVHCTGQKGDHGRTSNPHLSGVNVPSFHERGLLKTIGSILEGIPILGPILGPIFGSLPGMIGLSEIDVSSASNSFLNAEQIATLANFEFALSNAAHKVLLSNENPQVGAQSKLKARGVVPLGELATAVPMIGPFLRPMLPLLEALNLDDVGAKPGSVFSLALLNEAQFASLALFQTVLLQEVENVFPNANNSTPLDAPLPSKASPNDVMPSPTPEPHPGASEDDGSDSDAPSPADVPDSTNSSSPAPR